MWTKGGGFAKDFPKLKLINYNFNLKIKYKTLYTLAETSTL
jgi:hypothetical protein